jgi:hypothetical protein
MSRISDEVESIRALARRSDQISVAQARALSLIENLSQSELGEARPLIDTLLSCFLPKRQREIVAAWERCSSALDAQSMEETRSVQLAPRTADQDYEQGRLDEVEERVEEQPREARLDGLDETQSSKPVEEIVHLRLDIGTDRTPIPNVSDARELTSELRETLQELSDHYLYQWERQYRPVLNDVIARSSIICSLPGPAAEVLRGLRREFAEHVCEIFEKGVEYNVLQRQISPSFAIQKNQRGLTKFLKVTVEAYVSRIGSNAFAKGAHDVRRICSAILTGIFRGYSRVQYEDLRCSTYLAEHPEDWAEYVAFLTSDDLERLIADLPQGLVRRGLNDVVYPIASAIDRLSREDPQQFGPPILGQYTEREQRLELALPLARRKEEGHDPSVQVHCYLSDTYADLRRLEELAYRGVGLIAASLPQETSVAVLNSSVLRSVVVDTNSADAINRATTVLHRAAAQRAGRRSASPLTYNYAKLFPVHDPTLGQRYKVRRPSVRHLLGNVERRNGVHLWCSVRRSGKTTACFDLDPTTGSSVIIPQTCANTKEYPGSYVFFSRLEDALATGQALPRTFVRDVVQECFPTKLEKGQSVVFILDEYEILFGRLLGAVRSNPDLRYSVAQPLFHQLMGFARDNLLILVGQRPDAYNVLSDLNQLSPYVQQDYFPLFSHGGGGGEDEFRDLLARILPDPFVLDASFEDAVYAETGGHPYLTANVLVSFVDWLIEQQRRTSDLTLGEADFGAFTSFGLSPARIRIDPSLSWFLGVASEALGDYGRTQDPWLHAVYWTMRQIAWHHPNALTCSREELQKMQIFETERIPFSADYILATATRANFLKLEGDVVSPRIPLLCRLSAAAYPQPT